MKNAGKLLLLTTLVICLYSFSVSAETGHFTVLDSYWGAEQRIEASPGEVATFTIVLRTELLGPIKNIEANLTLPKNLRGLSGSNTSTAYYSGSLTQGMQLKLQFPMFITPEAQIGNY